MKKTVLTWIITLMVFLALANIVSIFFMKQTKPIRFNLNVFDIHSYGRDDVTHSSFDNSFNVNRLPTSDSNDSYSGEERKNGNSKEYNKNTSSKNTSVMDSEEKVQIGCKLPVLDPFNKHLAHFFQKRPDIDCGSQPSWIHFVSNDRIRLEIPKQNIEKFRDVVCNFFYILRRDDFGITFSDAFKINNNQTVKIKSDFFKLKCIDSRKITIHESFHATTVSHPELTTKNASISGPGYNVLIVGFDSVSHMNFRRQCKRTYRLLTETMKADILDGYNIVGDGTPQALIPILTGKKELELPSVLKRDKNSSRVDVYPFIWKDFSNSGYITAYAEDGPRSGCFTYRMTGFEKQPTHHFMRPFYLAIDPHLHKQKDFCLGSKRRSQIFLDWIKQFHVTNRDRKTLSFGFFSEISHNNANGMQQVDQDIYDFLVRCTEEKLTENTIMIVMSDHGVRIGGLRETVQGKLEERLPFFSFVFPESFKLKYQGAYKNFKSNTKRLTTPFDIYFTLRDIINYDGDGIGNVKDRGISLFKEIPLSRTCEDADIEKHWCTCLNRNPINLTKTVVQNAAKEIVNFINNITSSQRSFCQELKLVEILQAFEVTPHSNVLRFKRSKDADGRIPIFSANISSKTANYEIVLKTEPGGGIFEVTVTFDIKSETYFIKLENISRINLYGKSPICVEKEHENLRKYCVCKTT